MLAERTVRRLSIRAPADALARRAGFLIEDALRTATLPGDGAELVLLRRLRLPPFPADASPQQVALRLEDACRSAFAIDGTQADDTALAAAPAVRFADALSAHIALTRLVLADAARQAWCWPLLVKGYRPALGSGAALRTLALSLATLPEAPAALPAWLSLLVAHGEGQGCAVLLLALQGDDTACLQQACQGARQSASGTAAARWQSLLAWSAGRLGVDDGRHRWLRDMASQCGVDLDRLGRWTHGDDQQACERGLASEAAIHPAAGDGGLAGGEEADASAAPLALLPRGLAAAPAGAPEGARAAGTTPDPVAVAETGSAARPLAAETEAVVASDARSALPAGKAAIPTQPSRREECAGAEAGVVAPATGERSSPAAVGDDDVPATVEQHQTPISVAAVTTVGGLLYLVPLLTRLGLADFLRQQAAPSDLPQRIFATLLRRLPIADDDPLWLLSGGSPGVDRAINALSAADGEAARWLTLCRRHLRCRVGIGLYSLVCRPARVAITATHIDIRQGLDAVDMRIRRAGLDVDPGWVPWLGRVLRFHYGRDCW